MRSHPYLVCSLALLAAAAASIALGPEPIPLGDTIRILGSRVLFLAGGGEGTRTAAERILLDIRLPDTVKYALAGAALAGSGAAYQGLLRNPLADPYLIGVAPGAALGAVIAIVSGWTGSVLGFLAVPASAFAGAMATVAAVYRLSRVGKSTPVTVLILAGVAVGALANAAAYLIMLRSQAEIRRVVYFMLGGFELDGWLPVLAALPYVACGLAVVVVLARPINVLQFGDEQAAQLGLPVERLRLILVAAASLAAAAAVSFLGIIGFVGLIVPHVVRLIWGPDHRRLIPLSIIGGAAFLVLAATANRTSDELRALPLGVVTAFLGAPFFLYLLHRVRRSYW
jgi:iron complex transport system permease protein